MKQPWLLLWLDSEDENMTQSLQVTIDDVKVAMEGDERVALRIQLAAATRRITELEADQCQCAQLPSNGLVPVEAVAE
jgi:hypothetical protein